MSSKNLFDSHFAFECKMKYLVLPSQRTTFVWKYEKYEKRRLALFKIETKKEGGGSSLLAKLAVASVLLLLSTIPSIAQRGYYEVTYSGGVASATNGNVVQLQTQTLGTSISGGTPGTRYYGSATSVAGYSNQQGNNPPTMIPPSATITGTITIKLKGIRLMSERLPLRRLSSRRLAR